MSLPLTFLAGLLVLFLDRELSRPIAGSGCLDELLRFAWLLLVPAVLALLALRLVRRELTTGRAARVPPRALLRLSCAATLLVLHTVLGPGGWSDLAQRAAGGSQLLDIVLLLLPLLLCEVPRLVLATAADLHLEFVQEHGRLRPIPPGVLPGPRDLLPILRGRLGWPLLLLMPCALFGAAVDLLRLDRELYALFLATSPGATAGTLLFFAGASMLLPYWFRFAFGIVRHVPEPAGSRLRDTAAALGFPPRSVLYLPTGMRAMNAMMVGPLPVGRFLCVTDGLVRMLDIESLTGVVAHEVGHARRGHPLLLMTLAAVVPLLLPAPLRQLQLDRLDAGAQALLGLGAALVLWAVVRAVAHRFEHEADAASVDALGAGPCTRALLVVARAAVPQTHRLRRVLSLHPEEPRRLEYMRRYESEPAFRAAFVRRGRQLRAAAAGLVLAVLATAAWAWLREWPIERTFWRFHAGDLRGAATAMAAVGDDVPEPWREGWQRLRDELGAALELAPAAQDWAMARPAFAAAAWPRGVATLLRDGPAAARPWIGLALEADPAAPLVHHTVYDYCEAAADEDPERMAEAAAVVRRLGVPAGLDGVFVAPIR
ncbi:MAG: M48 family metalloprotease [Planctomycetes bacterium]|nr:M48 family metalloprotease [Planctomycetota bacterium]